MKSLFRLFFVVALLGLSTLAFAEGEASQHVGNIPVRLSNLTTSDISSVVAKALVAREWRILERSDDKVVAYLKHRSNEAQVTFIITKDNIEMSCWGYAIKKSSGERVKPQLPEGWIGNIKRDISVFLNRASSEKL